MTRDETLQTIRDWANKRERIYYWSNDILKYHSTDHTGLPLDRLVIPKTRRSKVMKMAHDHTGHLGYKKVLKIIQKQFLWPGIYNDVLGW